ncbi:putative transcriptional regulator [Corynebacterium mustelae]|uniref:Putative transcriptional regulator n=1 Tax=Corynebacterium mustelae TaxID=571915 RepID=A0A0G3GYH0_9CORY|nr:hypothetical protein [Corynebacterium mustelae]AKK05605.1 putative transcriptional regulator [Corynebacterium mustelae]
MTKPARPRPAIELFPESLSLSLKQRAVLDVLNNFPDGARVSQVAETLGMHINTARGHLDELVERKAIFAETAPATGRGRPSLIYRLRIPDNRTVANEYLTLINVMSKYLGDGDQEQAHKLAQLIGQEWGEKMIEDGFKADNINDAVRSLCGHLQQMGFDPEIKRDAKNSHHVDVCMHSCPFVNDEGELGDFMCDIHQGMLQHHRNLSPLRIDLQPLMENGKCMISITEPDEDNDNK